MNFIVLTSTTIQVLFKQLIRLLLLILLLLLLILLLSLLLLLLLLFLLLLLSFLLEMRDFAGSTLVLSCQNLLKAFFKHSKKKIHQSKSKIV